MKKLIFVLGAFFLIGCGGGGGGGSSVPPHVYTGVKAPAVLDNTFEAGQFASAILSTSMAGAFGQINFSLAGEGGASATRSVNRSLRTAVLNAARKVVPPTGISASVQSQPRPATYPPEQIWGVEGGTMTVTVRTGFWTGQIEYVSGISVTFQAFDDVADGVANPIDGSMSISPTSWTDIGYTVYFPVYYAATFDLHVTLVPGEGGRITGTLDYDQYGTSGTESDLRKVYTWTDTLFTDDRTRKQFLWKWLEEIDEDIYTDRVLMTITGTVYLSDLGYVTVSTVEPFDYPTGSELLPVSGELRMTGAGGPPTQAWATVPGAARNVLVDVDWNGDGAVDDWAEYYWEELLQ